MPESLESLAVKLETVVGQLNVHLTECTGVRSAQTKAMSDMAEAVELVAKDIGDIKKTPMRAVRWLGGMIIAGAALTNVLTYLNNQEAAQKATQAASAATVSAAATTKLTTKVDRVSSALGIPTNTLTP